MRFLGPSLVFVCTAVASAVLLAFPSGGLSAGIAWAALAAGAAAGLASAARTSDPDPPPFTSWEVLMLAVFALASLRAFLWLIYPSDGQWMVLSPNNLGDISLHIHLIRYLAGGVAFWPESPILAGTPLTYPPGSDLFNSLLLLAGVPCERGLIWTGLAGAALAALALRRWGGAFALAAWLFNGGLAGFALFSSGQWGDYQADLAWKNLFLSVFVTQRAMLYALPCGLLLLTTWRQQFFRGSRPLIPAWSAWLLYSTLPLFSVHTFLFLILTLAAAFLVHPPARKRLAAFVACSIIPASLAVYFVSGHFSAVSGIRWHPGWMQAGGGAWFWILNFGAAVPLSLLLIWRLARGREPEAVCFAGTAFLVFGLCCLLSFAPWEWDNTKLMLWSWIACAPLFRDLLAGWHPAPRAAACFLLFFSGAVSLVGGLDGRHGYKLASQAELAVAGHLLRNVPLGDRIAIEPDYNNPVILLGRPVLCGYEGHLWSHGLNFRGQWDALQEALGSSPGWQDRLREWDVRWLYRCGPPPSVRKIPAPPKRDQKSPATEPTSAG